MVLAITAPTVPPPVIEPVLRMATDDGLTVDPTAPADTEVAALAAALVACPSVTPDDGGCQDLIAARLRRVGFACADLSSDAARNLWACHGHGRPITMFLGHTDVVSPGEPSLWHYPPFGGRLVTREGREFLYGRGSADMKGAVAALALALSDFVIAKPRHPGTVGLLLTSNEEGDGVGGTASVAERWAASGERPTYCLVGEPSSARRLGDTVKIGRRGSLSVTVTVGGRGGHVAYPERVRNPVPLAAAVISAFTAEVWDDGTAVFPPTSFQFTGVRTDTGVENLVPSACTLTANWRFNPLQSPAGLQRRVAALLTRLALPQPPQLCWKLNGMPFATPRGALLSAVEAAVIAHCGYAPAHSTAGGTSDGRFIAPLGAQVVELGPVGTTMHQPDECVAIADLGRLRRIYAEVLTRLSNTTPE